jgi:tRNA pseudouridine38-40 synthase
MNHYLPRSVRVVAAREMPASFHAQKNAVSKIYEYRVLNRRYPSALETRALFFPRSLDWDRVRKGMSFFVGTHDFRAFQGAKADVKSTVRTIRRFDLDESASQNGLYRLEIEGEGFLKQMVRAIVGTLLDVGEGKRDASTIPDIINSCDRRLAGPTAPAQGLCLVRVCYDS